MCMDVLSPISNVHPGSSASTDRKTQLSATGNLQDTAGTLKNFASKLFSSGTAATNAGLSDTASASKYYSDILSGDPTKVAAAAAPEINAITGQAEQQKKLITNTGNRAGGTNATAQGIESGVRGQVADTIAKQKAGAASGLERTGAQASSVGLGETGQGISAEGTAGSEYASLINSSIASRQVSQKIHDDAVQQWATVIGDVLGAAV